MTDILIFAAVVVSVVRVFLYQHITYYLVLRLHAAHTNHCRWQFIKIIDTGRQLMTNMISGYMPGIYLSINESL
jgi:hypothetical protein